MSSSDPVISNYTTSVDASRTVPQVQGALAAFGATSIGVTYANREPVGLTFTLSTPHGPRSFALPVNAAGVLAVLRRHAEERRGLFVEARHRRAFVTEKHAHRVAWRILKDWLVAQLALVDAAMVTAEQVMLPYLVVDDTGRTLFDRYREHEQLALSNPAGGDDA